jgi:hypothetical protein
MASMLFAIKQVPRQTGTQKVDNSESKIEIKQETKAEKSKVVQKREREQDRFIDKNSNGVNDRREDDFQNIKTKKSKHKELLKKDADRDSKKQKVERQQKPKTSNQKRERTKTSSKGRKKEK